MKKLLWGLSLLVSLSSVAGQYERIKINEISGNCVHMNYYWQGSFAFRGYNGWVCAQRPSNEDILNSILSNESLRHQVEEDRKRGWRSSYYKYIKATQNPWSKKCAEKMKVLHSNGLISGKFFPYTCDRIDNRYSYKCLTEVALDESISEIISYAKINPYGTQKDLASCGAVNSKLRLGYIKMIIGFQEAERLLEGASGYNDRITVFQLYSTKYVKNQFNFECGILGYGNIINTSAVLAENCQYINTSEEIENLRKAIEATEDRIDNGPGESGIKNLDELILFSSDSI